MKALTFQEIRNIVHAICEDVDNAFSDDIPVGQRIDELCHEYWPMWGDVWSAAAGMRFEYFDAWYDAEEQAGELMGTIDEQLFKVVHDCLTMLVQDAHENGDHLPE